LAGERWFAIVYGFATSRGAGAAVSRAQQAPAGRANSNQNTQQVETMANSKQARKRARQSSERNTLKSAQRSRVRSAIKSVRKAIAGGDAQAAQTVLRSATHVIDSIADKGVVHKNHAARNKSRLAAAIKAMA
jgi:small subunit ribosomal protein S20